jgi:hypothetical protein
MIEAKIRVEKTTTNKLNTHYYGNVVRKSITEDILYRDFDKRGDEIAPSGIKCILCVGDKDVNGEVYEGHVYDITINRYYLDYLDTDDGMIEYYCHFSVDGRIYEFTVFFDCTTKKIKDYYIEEWYDEGDFENGDNPANVYKNDVVTLIEYIC